MGDALLELLADHRCHLVRDDRSVHDFLKDEFSRYLSDLQNACEENKCQITGKGMCDLIGSHIDEIEENANALLLVLKLHENGKIIEASNRAFEIFEKMKPYLMTKMAGAWRTETYYRIRAYDGFNLERKELFHIPIGLRHYIKTERYSMPGHPCLYLASQAPLCWYECNMPSDFAIAKFDIPQSEKEHFSFIDFAEKLMPLKHSFISWFLNGNDIDLVQKYLLKYLYIMPLRAACSVDVRYPKAAFKEEYIIPQLLLQWVASDVHFDGIMYESCKNDDEVHCQGGHNLVLVTKEFDSDGYDKKLRMKVGIGEPFRFDINTFVPSDVSKDILDKLGKDIKTEPWHWDLESISSDYEKI